MGISQTKRQAWAVVVEDTAGTYKAPTVSTEFVQLTTDGSELSFSKETVERNVFTGTIGKVSPRNGTTSVSGSMTTEFKAHSTQGAAPEFDKLIKGALGSRRQLTSEVTTLTGNTASVLKVPDASVFNVDDIVMIKEAGKFHVSPIKSVDLVDDEIELLIPAATAFSDAVKIAKHTTYIPAESGHESFSVSRYFNGSVVHKAMGCKVTSMQLGGFTTGSIPTLAFGFEGLNFDAGVSAIPVAPAYDNQQPPIILDARLFIGGQMVCVNELTLNLENTLGFVSCISAENGKKNSYVTERSISGSFDPYMADDTVETLTKYKAGTAFDVVAYAKLPSSVAGEFSGVVAVYLKNCVFTDVSLADDQGNLKENISFSVDRGNSGTVTEMVVTFI